MTNIMMLLNRVYVKKIMKILSVVAAIFLSVLVYLESQGIMTINWDKLQGIARSTVSSLTGLITTASNGNNSSTLLPVTNSLCLSL